MFRKLLAAVGLNDKERSDAAASGQGNQLLHSPYANGAANTLYNLLFCDNPAAFRPQAGQEPAGWQTLLFSDEPNRGDLHRLANDPAQEGRVRYLTFCRLRDLGEPVAAKVLLAVIVEVGLDGGLDVLAAFADGGVRYINQTGKVEVLEGVPQLEPMVQALFAVAQPVVDQIGPWDQTRRPAPSRDAIRMSFLVSDGLYFGEGPMATMQRDPMAGPIIQRATELLQAVVRMAVP